MISFIRGVLDEVFEDRIVVDCRGVGYQMRIPAARAGELPPVGREVKIYTHMSVREDAVGLYGFLSREERDLFRLLITVNGIGPKAGLGILSVISPDELRFAVLSEDVKAIAEAPGVGKKTAQKLILELKDKMKLTEGPEFLPEKGAAAGWPGEDTAGEAVQALTALGYSPSEAMKAVRAVGAPPEITVEELLKLALKNLSRM